MLAFCILVTAFIQRERVLPTTLNAEVGKVAERFGQEMQKAFLPTTIETEMTESEPTQVTNEKVKESASLTERINTVLVALPNLAMEKPHVISPKNSTIHTSSRQNITTNPELRYPDIPNFTFLKSYGLGNLQHKESITFSYIFTKNNTYLITFVDCITNLPTDKKVPFQITDSQGNIMPFEVTAKGYAYTVNATGLFYITFEKGFESEILKAIMYFSRKTTEKVSSSLEPFLADMNGKKINIKKKVNTKNGLQIIFTPNEKNKDAKIESIVFTVFREGKSVNQRICYDNKLDFAGMKLKRGDGIQITISKATVPITKPYIGFFVK
jgi:hypothetical protein